MLLDKMKQIKCKETKKEKDNLVLLITYIPRTKEKPLLEIEIDYPYDAKFPLIRVVRYRYNQTETCYMWGIPSK